MPLMKYFGFVLLLGMSWCFLQLVSDRIPSGIDRPVIRINSVEKLPDRVDIDTSVPTTVPSSILMEMVEQQPMAKPPSLNAGPTEHASHNATTKQGKAERAPVKKVAAHPASPAQIQGPG